MLRYILKRIVLIFVTLFFILSASFFVLRSLPGSFIKDINMRQEVKRAIEDKFHLHDPLYVQYGYFLQDFFKGDFGVSIVVKPNVKVNDILALKVPVSMQINIFSLLFSLPIAVLLGIWSALKKNMLTDHIISILIIAAISVPSFIFASVLQYMLAFKFGWFPIVVSTDTTLTLGKFHSLILPIVSLALGSVAGIARYTRAELTEALNSEYMLLAKAKGLTQFQATVNHAFRNSFVPLANIIIPMFTAILGGSLVIEKIFAIPGMGSVMLDAINAQDYPLALGVLFWYSLLGLVTTLFVDISYGIIDPSIRIGGKNNG